MVRQRAAVVASPPPRAISAPRHQHRRLSLPRTDGLENDNRKIAGIEQAPTWNELQAPAVTADDHRINHAVGIEQRPCTAVAVGGAHCSISVKVDCQTTLAPGPVKVAGMSTTAAGPLDVRARVTVHARWRSLMVTFIVAVVGLPSRPMEEKRTLSLPEPLLYLNDQYCGPTMQSRVPRFSPGVSRVGAFGSSDWALPGAASTIKKALKQMPPIPWASFIGRPCRLTNEFDHTKWSDQLNLFNTEFSNDPTRSRTPT